MTTSSHRESARIYTFPARGRFAVNERRDEAKPAALTLPQGIKAAVGSGWYHDAAIQESAEQARTS